jgi:hypothetical protein
MPSILSTIAATYVDDLAFLPFIQILRTVSRTCPFINCNRPLTTRNCAKYALKTDFGIFLFILSGHNSCQQVITDIHCGIVTMWQTMYRQLKIRIRPLCDFYSSLIMVDLHIDNLSVVTDSTCTEE